MKTANMHEAKTKLSELVDAATKGEEVVICKAGKPVVRLVPVTKKPARRKLGLWKGKVWMAPDWDSPEVNEEIARLFEEGDPPS
ncbi:type II toxin-antitoxin system Phd/YefM family antitoxin [Vineibacter terrae]|uniref:Antitoxin n=1 Tax=Vineibacter terrae TaxID=2586908 RepID=A0A5C8PKQ8_9HYPH|nr:type II toxin-antitoxin system prevent-host-death family antitoxin [Vineibacter terrae]TXL74141.1 type II toxin-antitoxin system Phd/YefM family antitoxin [Vineibacter terrae]HEX2885820.1 type II toxin-antitoxin system prevent-host-death family antitoxin [Vineibacter terrae]